MYSFFIEHFVFQQEFDPPDVQEELMLLQSENSALRAKDPDRSVVDELQLVVSKLSSDKAKAKELVWEDDVAEQGCQTNFGQGVRYVETQTDYEDAHADYVRKHVDQGTDPVYKEICHMPTQTKIETNEVALQWAWPREHMEIQAKPLKWCSKNLRHYPREPP